MFNILASVSSLTRGLTLNESATIVRPTMSSSVLSSLDLPKNLKKIFVNAPLMARIVCKVLAALIISGYFNFLPKFLAAQYHLGPRTASIASGKEIKART